jgi:hypothetical protein
VGRVIVEVDEDERVAAIEALEQHGSYTVTVGADNLTVIVPETRDGVEEITEYLNNCGISAYVYDAD